MFGYRLIIIDKALFVRKLFMLLAFSAGLIPLLLYKSRLGVALYVAMLLVLHVYFVAVYLWRVPWRDLLKNKLQFIIRVSAVVFFMYALAALQRGENIVSVIAFLCISAFIHVILLLLLMVKVEPALTYEPARNDDSDHEN